jgi:hypothetical protein
MDALLARNRSGELRAGPAERGFYDGARRCRGLTKLLRIHLRAGKRTRVAPIARAGWRTMASSRTTGTRVHAALQHMIADGGSGAPASDAFSRACVAAARVFLRDAGLAPVASELVLAHPRFPVATRADAVCRDTASGATVVVSWKTGAGAADECEVRRHRTQAAFEWSLLEAAGERVAAAHVVYLGAVMRGGVVAPYYRVNSLARDDALALANHFAGALARRWPALAGD